MTKFLRVSYRTNGGALTTAISGPYTRLVNVATYARRVMAGSEPFALWASFSGVHPISGAPCAMRERILLNGRDVVTIEEVAWTSEHTMPRIDVPDSSFWTRVVRPAPGARGTFKVRFTRLATRLEVPLHSEFPIESHNVDTFGPTDVIALNADGSRIYAITLDAIYHGGERVIEYVPDEEDDAAAAVGGRDEDTFVEDDEEESL